MLDARASNLALLREQYPTSRVEFVDMEAPVLGEPASFDVVYCYGLLYHVQNPIVALDFMSDKAGRLLLLETCVSFGRGDDLGLISEPASDPTEAFSGTGSRPTRAWIFSELRSRFEYVYLPVTQPNHEEFPLNWAAPEEHSEPLQRAIFVASREPIDNELLVTELPEIQRRHA